MTSANKISPLTNISLIKSILLENNIQAKKSFGQNFLINDGVIKKIISLADIKDNDKCIEIGPGLGSLTLALLNSKADVFAIEKDKTIIDILKNNVSNYCENHVSNFEVLPDDALKIDFDKLDSKFSETKIKLVSNLPYNVAAPLIITYFQNLPNLNEAIVMVQKEIADRIMANPGNKNYGAYTVKLSLYADVVDKFAVSRTNFIPQPRVDSTVIKLKRNNYTDKRIADTACLIADAAFAHRRKTISNSIKQYFSEEINKANKIIDSLISVGVNPNIRAESLTREDFIKTTKKFLENNM